MADSLTVLATAPGCVAAKRINCAHVEPYDAGMFFRHGAIPVDGPRSLFDAVRKLASQPRILVVRGAVRPGAPEVIRRRYLGDGADIEPAARQWLCVDVDSVASSVAVETDPEIAARDIRRALPEGLRDATCLVQFTASAKGRDARAHAWLWLDAPVSDAVAKAALRDFDTSLYGPVQPHYVADPIFVDCDDPLPVRHVALDGEPTGSLAPRRDDARCDHALRLLRRAERDIKGIRTGDARHPVVNRRAYQLGRYVPGGYLDETEITERLFAAATSGANPLPSARAADEIKRAIADGKGRAVPPNDWREALSRTDGGAIRPTVANVATILLYDPAWAGCLGWDAFAGRGVVLRDPPLPAEYAETIRRGSQITDTITVPIAAWLAAEWACSASVTTIWDAALAVAKTNPIHPVREYLDGLSWDGTERLSTWLTDYLGVVDSDYVRDVARAWLVSAIARVREPGCQADHVLVLEGETGIGKSSALRILGGTWYDSLIYDHKSRDAWMALQGALIVEFEELQGLRPGEEQAIKAFVTRCADRFRVPYGRVVEEFPRQCVFAGTTNEAGYIHDSTSLRRWWPVECRPVVSGKYVDRDGLSNDRDQLFAEADRAYRDGADWHLADERAARIEQAKRMSVDPWAADIRSYLRGSDDGATVSDLLSLAVCVPAAQQSRYQAQRVTEILRAMGATRDGDKWLPPDATD